MKYQFLLRFALTFLPLALSGRINAQVINCNIFNYSNSGSCHTANIECVMVVDQAFVDKVGEVMLARLKAEAIFDSMRVHMTPLLTSQGYATTFRLIHFTDFVAPNSWNSGSAGDWATNVGGFWSQSEKVCIKKDVIILL